MEHTPLDALKWDRGAAATFTGNVWSCPLSRAPDRTVAALGVLFEPGARTFWHSHPDGQVLYVASGAGRVGSEDGAVIEVGTGDVIYTAAGESHWHGARPDSYMMHISMTTGGPTVWDSKAVSDAEYNAG
ncbi:MAG TPA: cupin domain-containing protein [Acidimicrobiia bacterium]|jgi:quercetin dioxygenase-like cupin family protein